MTIDLGYAYWPQPDGRVLGFIDVPGHEKFLSNMLAGSEVLTMPCWWWPVMTALWRKRVNTGDPAVDGQPTANRGADQSRSCGRDAY